MKYKYIGCSEEVTQTQTRSCGCYCENSCALTNSAQCNVNGICEYGTACNQCGPKGQCDLCLQATNKDTYFNKLFPYIESDFVPYSLMLFVFGLIFFNFIFFDVKPI